MLELEENKRFLNTLQNNLYEISESMNINSLRANLDKLKTDSQRENFWQDTEKSSKVFAMIKTLEKKINNYDSLNSELVNLFEMNELLEIEFDNELLNDLLRASKLLSIKLDELKIQTYFSGKYDSNNAIITLHPGARWYRITRLGSNVIQNVWEMGIF